LGAAGCGTFGKIATGVQGTNSQGVTQIPAFCYRITVTNCGTIPLTSVTVIDTIYGDLTALCFPGATPHTLDVGAGCAFTFKAEVPDPNFNDIAVITNVVTGTGVGSGITVSNIDHAVVRVVPAAVECIKQYTIDGGPRTNNAPCIQDANPHTIVWYLTIKNV